MGRINVRPRKKSISTRFAAKTDIRNANEVFKGLGSFLDLLSDMEKKGEKKAMYGFSVEIGGSGIPIFEHFGNIVRETGNGQVLDEEREPVVEIHEEEDTLEIIVELPGIDEKDISYEIKDDVLTLTAGSDERKYSKEVKLPCKVSLLKTAYQNGIFKISLKRE